MLPLADATVLGRLAPLLEALLAPLLLGEPGSRAVWLALPPCLLGVILIAQPSALFGSASRHASDVGSESARHVSAGALAIGLSQASGAEGGEVVALHAFLPGMPPCFGHLFTCMAQLDPCCSHFPTFFVSTTYRHACPNASSCLRGILPTLRVLAAGLTLKQPASSLSCRHRCTPSPPCLYAPWLSASQ